MDESLMRDIKEIEIEDLEKQMKNDEMRLRVIEKT